MEDRLFWTIKEAGSILELEPYILRYWEEEFKEIKPERTSSGHRRYRKQDIELLKEIKELLYNKGFTIKGVKKYLKSKEKELPNFITEVKEELKNILSICV